MRVFVTGGTGVVGSAAVTALVGRGHEVRLFSRHAPDEIAQWPSGVEARAGDVSDAASLSGAMAGCDAVLHLAGVVAEDPPEVTYERVNVEGTRHVVAEAGRAGVRRLVYTSSLGAERGTSGYHRSKFAGEEIVRGFAGAWLVLRPGNVYGPGDQIISLLLKMMRTLPGIPVIDGGDHPFQPMWVGDLAEALAKAMERDDLAGRTLDLTGPDRTSMNDLITRFERITGRTMLRIPMPGTLASWGARLGEAAGFDMPINEGQITMLEEGNVIERAEDNALDTVFGVTPTGIAEGLAKLADALPEQLPESGVGGLKHRHVWADIENVPVTAEALFERFRREFSTITPWQMDVGAEPGTPTEPREGATLTMHLPLRGNVQVRIEELTPTRLTLVSLEGHPLAGAVHFACDATGPGRVRFEVKVYDRSSNVVDWLIMAAGGSAVQRATWSRIVETMVEESGGTAPSGVHHETRTLHGAEAEEAQQRLRDLVTARKRAENTGRVPAPHEASDRPGA